MGLDWTLKNPCEAIDAPMVETEERAREMWDEYVHERDRFETFEEFWNWANPETRDEPLVDCERCRVWRAYDGARGGSFMTQPCEWRGKRLRYTTLPDRLLNRAYEDMTPAQMLDYAADLRDYLDDLTDEAERETVEEAADWLEFWAGHGVGMNAWY